MNDHLFSRKAAIFTAAACAAALSIAALGALNTPAYAWAWMIARRSSTLIIAADAWGLTPVTLGLALLLNPFGARLNRRLPVVPERQVWADRVVYVIGLYMITAQLLLTLGLVAYWNPALKHLLGGDPHAPQFLGLADPNHLITRAWLIGGGTLCIWFGNGIPKFLIAVQSARQEPGEPRRGQLKPADWNRKVRARGWIWVLGGAALALCAAFMPMTEAYRVAVIMILAAMILASIAIRLTSKLGGDAKSGKA